MYFNENTIIYHNGAFVKAKEATIDLYSQSLHYGMSVFEGIRSYKTLTNKTRIFKAEEHFVRLEASAKALNLPYAYTMQQLIEATYEVLRLNNLADAYIRPLVYAPANMSFAPNTASFMAIQAWEMAPFLGDKLLKVGISSFQRPNPKAFIITAKAAGHYINSILASQEVKAKGFDEALLTDVNGFIAEGPGANIFMQKNGCLYTPALGNILPGITRATIMELAAEMHIEVVECNITVEELLRADAAFFCGTAAEVIGIQSINNVELPLNWESSIGKIMQAAYKQRVTQE